MYVVNERVSLDGYLATIKFVGYLPDHIWGAKVLALGLEWDQLERGRNNGDIDGVHYFYTDVEGSGSFVKATNKKLAKRKDFIEALLEKYHPEDNHINDTIKFGAKEAEKIGFDKLEEIQSDFKNLRTISLNKENIYNSFNDEALVPKLVHNLACIRNLDLSYNLFNDLNKIWEIIDPLSNLKELVLDGNRFFNSINEVKHNFSVKKLSLCFTKLNVDLLFNVILKKFPCLEEIGLACNDYDNIKLAHSALDHKRLSRINLSGNYFQLIPTGLLIYDNVHELDLGGNLISSFCTDRQFYNVLYLDVSRNRVDNWKEIDALASSFPNLEELRVNGNPLFNGMEADEMMNGLIARFECGSKNNIGKGKVRKLNGVALTEDEIKNAELYFISKVKRGLLSFDTGSQRWLRMIKKYQITNEPIQDYSENIKWSNMVPLTVKLENEKILFHKNFPLSASILRIKGTISRHLDLPILYFKVYFYADELSQNTKKLIKHYFDDNNSVLDYYGISPNQTMYVELLQCK